MREAVKAWRAADYKGITDTTRVLLKHWFYNDHKLRTGAPFKYHPYQQEAIETLIFVWEAEKVRGTRWQYLKVGQKVFETLQPTKLEHLAALTPRQKKLI